MPKLNKKIASAVEKSEAWEGGGRTLLEPGRYAAQLFRVEERQGQKAPYWNWRFVNIHDEDGDMQGRTNLFLSTSLSDRAYGGLKKVFTDFGYTPDSDTDEMIGEWVVLQVDQEVQQAGKNAGNLTNVVKATAPFDEDDWAFDPSEVAPYEERDKSGSSAGVMDDPSF